MLDNKKKPPATAIAGVHFQDDALLPEHLGEDYSVLLPIVQSPERVANGDIFASLSGDMQTKLLAILASQRPSTDPTVDDSAEGSGRYSPISAVKFLAKDFPPLEFLVDGMLAKGHLAMLGGRPKSGKSWLVLQMAQAIDLGTPFLGRNTRKARVLYVALEDGERRLSQRCKISRWLPSPDAGVMTAIANFDGNDSTPGAGVDTIASLAESYDLIVIDTLIATLSGNADENSNTQMGGIVNQLATIAHDTDTAIVLVHHTKKGGGGDDDIFSTFRGASALRGAYDVGLLLERKIGEREAVLHMESRDLEMEPMTIRQAPNSAGWEHIGDGQVIGQIQAGRRVVEALRSEGDGSTSQQLADSLKISVQAVRKQLTNAERDGLVRRETANVAGSFRPTDLWHLVEAGNGVV